MFYCIKNHGLKYNNYSFSQEGEDIIIDVLLNYKAKGFYVDFGALHPMRFSNTMHFYSRGWNGVNVDAMPGSMQLFDKIRPQDINVEAGISGEGARTYILEFRGTSVKYI